MRLDAARAVPGALDILHHGNVGEPVRPPPPLGGGAPITTLESPRIWHDGQIVAVIVAETYEAAREAAFGRVAPPRHSARHASLARLASHEKSSPISSRNF